VKFVNAAVRLIIAGVGASTVYLALMEDESAWDTLPLQATVAVVLVQLIRTAFVLADVNFSATWIEVGATVYAVVQGVLLTVRDDIPALTQELFLGLTVTQWQLWVIPGVAVVAWALFGRSGPVAWSWVLIWPLYVLAYTGGFAWRGQAIENAEYPHAYLNLDSLEWRGVAENGLVFGLAVMVVGAALIAADRFIPRGS